MHISRDQMVKARVIRLRVIEGPNASDQIVFCAFHPFLVEVQMNAGYIHNTQCNNMEIRIARLFLSPAIKTYSFHAEDLEEVDQLHLWEWIHLIY